MANSFHVLIDNITCCAQQVQAAIFSPIFQDLYLVGF